MNAEMIRRLVLKDWFFHRGPILASFAAGVVALAMQAVGGDALFYGGSVLMITTVIGLGLYLAIATVVQERRDGTLAFVMTLPVSARDHFVSKLIANLTMFALPWCGLAAGTVWVILARDGIPDGLLPFAVLLLLELMVGYVMVLGVAIVTESQSWTIGAIVVGNLGVQGFMYFTARLPAIAETIATQRVSWNSQVLTLMAAEVVAILLILVVTWRIQSRKTDFI